MKKTILVLVLFPLFYTPLIGQHIKDLDVNFMLRGRIYAQSSIEDTEALGGFASSNNSPKKMKDNLGVDKNELFLKIDTTEVITTSKQCNGYNLLLVNKSDSIVKLKASDSRLYVIAEVYFENKWQPIEYIPRSWCGNSFHNVFLKPNEFWSFDVPKFSGKIKTKLRYRLAIKNGQYIYSNEIRTSINKGQLSEKEGYQPAGIMDPYDE